MRLAQAKAGATAGDHGALGLEGFLTNRTPKSRGAHERAGARVLFGGSAAIPVFPEYPLFVRDAGGVRIRELGPWGMAEYLETKRVHINLNEQPIGWYT